VHEAEKPVILRSSGLIAMAASSPGATLDDMRRALLARSFSAIQPSDEKRSRTRLALEMAEASVSRSGSGTPMVGSTP